MNRGAWRATYSPRGHKESDMTEQLNLPSYTLRKVLCLVAHSAVPMLKLLKAFFLK